MTQELTYGELLRECGKTLVTSLESKQSKERLQSDIETYFLKWIQTHLKELIEPDHLMGIIFPQTPTHEPIVVSQIFTSKTRSLSKPTTNVLSDEMLRTISQKTVDFYHTCQKQKQTVAWTWPIIEMYFNQFYNEAMKERQEQKENEPTEEKTRRVRIASKQPRGIQTISLTQLGVAANDPVYVVVSFPLQEPILQQMYACLMDYQQINGVQKIMRHENVKFKETILSNILNQHQKQKPVTPIVPSIPQIPQVASKPLPSMSQIASSSAQQIVSSVPPTPPPPSMPALLPRYKESVAIQSKHHETPVEVKFEIKTKPAYTHTKITRDNYLNMVRVKHTRSNTDFESMLITPIGKSIRSHPFYLFLHDEWTRCREETFRSTHPHEPLLQAPVLHVRRLKRKLDC